MSRVIVEYEAFASHVLLSSSEERVVGDIEASIFLPSVWRVSQDWLARYVGVSGRHSVKIPQRRQQQILSR